jgi:hypothetical protein
LFLDNSLGAFSASMVSSYGLLSNGSAPAEVGSTGLTEGLDLLQRGGL